jgi:hypothetical protein
MNLTTAEDQLTTIPSPADITTPAMEWWDELYLPKLRRDARKISKASLEVDEYPIASIQHNKTYKYIQHPIPIKPLGSTAIDIYGNSTGKPSCCI